MSATHVWVAAHKSATAAAQMCSCQPPQFQPRCSCPSPLPMVLLLLLMLMPNTLQLLFTLILGSI
jgi:hypothetical protein